MAFKQSLDIVTSTTAEKCCQLVAQQEANDLFARSQDVGVLWRKITVHHSQQYCPSAAKFVLRDWKHFALAASTLYISSSKRLKRLCFNKNMSTSKITMQRNLCHNHTQRFILPLTVWPPHLWCQTVAKLLCKISTFIVGVNYTHCKLCVLWRRTIIH